MKIFTTFLMLVLSTVMFAQVTVSSNRSFFVQGNSALKEKETTYSSETFRSNFNSEETDYANYYKAPVYLFEPGRTFDVNDITKVELQLVVKTLDITAPFRLTIADISSENFTPETTGFDWFRDLGPVNKNLVDTQNGPEFIIQTTQELDKVLTWDITDMIKTSVGNVAADGVLAVILAPMFPKEGYQGNSSNQQFYSSRAEAVDINGDGSVLSDFRAKLVISGITTAVGDLEANKLSVVPNPATSVVTIGGVESGREINILNVTGTIVKKVIAASDLEVIDINDLNRGIYLVQVGDTTQRLIVK